MWSLYFPGKHFGESIVAIYAGGSANDEAEHMGKPIAESNPECILFRKALGGSIAAGYLQRLTHPAAWRESANCGYLTAKHAL